MNFISYDLGTGGIKASLYNEKNGDPCQKFHRIPHILSAIIYARTAASRLVGGF